MGLILYLDKYGNVLPKNKLMARLRRDYSSHVRGSVYRSKLVMPIVSTIHSTNGYFYDGRCPYCSGKHDWSLVNRSIWPIQALWHIEEHLVLPFILIMKERYPDVYEEVMMGNKVVPKYGNIDIVGDDRDFPSGGTRERAHDIVNLMDELLLVRDMSLRVYNEILDSGDIRYYGTAMMAVKEIRSVAETMGKFSLIAKQLEREGEVERLPGPIIDLIKEVAHTTNTSKVSNEEGVIVTP